MIDEAYVEMRCYIKFALHFGFPEDTIKSALIKAGWPLEKINKAIMEVKGAKPEEANKKAPAQEAIQEVPQALPALEEAPAPQ